MISNVKDVVGASAQQVEIYWEAASILRDRADSAFRTGMVVVEARRTQTSTSSIARPRRKICKTLSA
jgi:hypothetical protein